MNPIHAIAFDVDGTLFDYRSQTIPLSTKTAIQQLKQRNILIVLATARSYPELSLELVRDIAPDYYIVAGGHCIQDSRGRLLHSYRFSYEQTELVKKYALSCQAGLTLKYEDHNCLYTDPCSMYGIYSNIGQPCCPTIYCQQMDQHEKQLPVGFTIRGEAPIREQLCRLLQKHPKDFRLELFQNGIVADIFSPFVSKKTGLDLLSQRLGLEARHWMAFGDGRNDVEMLQWAGTGVAPQNGSPQARAASDRICGCIYEDGIARFLEEIRLTESPI